MKRQKKRDEVNKLIKFLLISLPHKRGKGINKPILAMYRLHLTSYFYITNHSLKSV